MRVVDRSAAGTSFLNEAAVETLSRARRAQGWALKLGGAYARCPSGALGGVLRARWERWPRRCLPRAARAAGRLDLVLWVVEEEQGRGPEVYAGERPLPKSSRGAGTLRSTEYPAPDRPRHPPQTLKNPAARFSKTAAVSKTPQRLAVSETRPQAYAALAPAPSSRRGFLQSRRPPATPP